MYFNGAAYHRCIAASVSSRVFLGAMSITTHCPFRSAMLRYGNTSYGTNRFFGSRVLGFTSAFFAGAFFLARFFGAALRGFFKAEAGFRFLAGIDGGSDAAVSTKIVGGGIAAAGASATEGISARAGNAHEGGIDSVAVPGVAIRGLCNVLCPHRERGEIPKMAKRPEDGIEDISFEFATDAFSFGFSFPCESAPCVYDHDLGLMNIIPPRPLPFQWIVHERRARDRTLFDFWPERTTASATPMHEKEDAIK